MGTEVAQELVLRHPEKVNRLVLYAADCGGQEAVQPSDEVVRKMLDKSGTQEEQAYRMFETLFPEDWLIRNRDYIFDLFSRMLRESTSEENIQKQLEAYQQWGGCDDRVVLCQSDSFEYAGRIMLIHGGGLLILNNC